MRYISAKEYLIDKCNVTNLESCIFKIVQYQRQKSSQFLLSLNTTYTPDGAIFESIYYYQISLFIILFELSVSMSFYMYSIDHNCFD